MIVSVVSLSDTYLGGQCLSACDYPLFVQFYNGTTVVFSFLWYPGWGLPRYNNNMPVYRFAFDICSRQACSTKAQLNTNFPV